MFKQSLLATVAALALMGTAQAQTAAALVGDNQIAHIDVKTLKVTKTVSITGLPGRITGIDVRPADGMIYALAEDGTVATIDAATGKATVKSKLETMLAKGVAGAVDFNPVADRMRIIGADGTSLRANVDDGKVAVDGKLKFKEGDANAMKSPNIVAAAYINSVKGAKETSLYDIDLSGIYARQAPPNDGILNTLGMTGVGGKTVAFDVMTDSSGNNSGWLIAGKAAYSIDLATGATKSLGMVTGLSADVRDVAVLPAM